MFENGKWSGKMNGMLSVSGGDEWALCFVLMMMKQI